MSLFSIPIDKVLSTVGGIADELTTSQEEILQAELESRRLDLEEQRINQAGDLAQIDVNKEAAKHPSVFVAGARPAIIWTGVVAINMAVTLPQLVMWVSWALHGGDIAIIPPKPEMAEVLTILGSVLGVGGMRSFDKYNGKQTERTE